MKIALTAGLALIGLTDAQVAPSATPAATIGEPTATVSRLEAVRVALNSAATDLRAASPANHGGFVEKGRDDLVQALAAANAALAFARAHPADGAPPASASPASDAALARLKATHQLDANRQPHMYDTLTGLKSALEALQTVPGGDFGGAREELITRVVQATDAVIAGIEASDRSPPPPKSTAGAPPLTSASLAAYFMPIATFPGGSAQPSGPLKFASGPAAMKAFLSDWTKRIPGSRPNLDPNTLRISLPLGHYHYVSDASAGEGLATSQPDLFYYMVTGPSGDPFANLTVRVAEGKSPAFDDEGISSNSQEAAIPKALGELLAMDRVKSGVYEPRLLRFITVHPPELAIWLKSVSGGSDLIYPIFASTPLKKILYTADEFRAIVLAAMASRRGVSRDLAPIATSPGRTLHDPRLAAFQALGLVRAIRADTAYASPVTRPALLTELNVIESLANAIQADAGPDPAAPAKLARDFTLQLELTFARLSALATNPAENPDAQAKSQRLAAELEAILTN